jgi:hypothetical protein
MAEESGAGEGQALAHRLLAALDAGQVPDWEAFHDAYRRWLTYIAGSCLARHGWLAHHFDGAEELVNTFLAEKVFPPRQAQLMFGTPARGGCPLRPRLATSLRNFSVDVLRNRTPRLISDTSDRLEMVETREQLSLPDYEDVASAIAGQLGVIRDCLPLNHGAPYRLALLMRHRLDWAALFDGVHLPHANRLDGKTLTLEVLEELTSWNADELKSPLGESLCSLGSCWEMLRPRLVAGPDRRLASDDVARAFRVPRDLWDQWVSRGRRRVRQKIGAEYSNLFALWA